ncbi:MAG: amidohydrolase family protein, partial [Candidatus Marinimicrobia bacterium]|nr:amidohydrolase family protein [Candidatus Neomarinimicrobiota bacterium]
MESTITRRNFIKTSALTGLGFIVGCTVKNRFDIIIRNGNILNGLGTPAARLDIGIKSDKIASIDDLSSSSADIFVDAKDLIVAPGFIDIHTHTDTELLINPKAESKIRQGITTEVSGNCGYSPFPLNREDRKELDEKLVEQYGIEVTWNNIDGFFKAIESSKTSINYMSFSGHGNLRSYVVGKNDVTPTKDQMDEMKRILAQSMEFGSLGLSTGLEYAPGSYAKTEELIELCKVVSQHNGIYATHMRNEDDTVEEAIEEALRICTEA